MITDIKRREGANRGNIMFELRTLIGCAYPCSVAHFWQALKQPPHRVFPVARSRWWCRSPPVARAMLPGALLRKA